MSPEAEPFPFEEEDWPFPTERPPRASPPARPTRAPAPAARPGPVPPPQGPTSTPRAAGPPGPAPQPGAESWPFPTAVPAAPMGTPMRQDGLDPFSALRLHRGDLVALIGGGGKTTLMFAICAAAHERGLTAVATTTTRLHWIDDEEHNRHWVVASEFQDPISAVLQLLRSKGHAVLVRDRGEIRTKLLGYSPEELSKLRGLCPADLWAVEADGSRGRPLKAPIAHEPIIPNGATVVILVVGMDVVGSRLSERNVHRYERVAELLGTEPGVCIGADDVARVVNHRAGYLARIPAGARRVLYLSKIGKKDHREAAMAVSAMVDRTSWPEVYMGEVLDGEPRVEPLERQGKASEPFPFF